MMRPVQRALPASAAANRTVDGESRRAAGDFRRARTDFERLLSERSERGQRKQAGDEPGVVAAAVPCLVAGVPGAGGTADEGRSEQERAEPWSGGAPHHLERSILPLAQPRDMASPGPRSAPPATAQEPGPTRAALEAALGTPLATPGSIAAAGWEVSIPQPTGAPLELRAGRLQQADGSAAWSLDIRAKGRELQPALVRAAARLADRLQARALRAHVRIDEDFEEDER